jgi:glycosyltransferase involved in cell wall biosynthesis
VIQTPVVGLTQDDRTAADGSRLRVLAVTAYWPPHRGGIETVAWEQAHRLARRGHQVSVVTSRLAGDPSTSMEEGFPVYRVSASNRLEERRGIPYPVFSPGLLPLLARLVPSHDVVLVHNHTYLSSVAATLVARHYRRPTVVIQYNPFVQYRFPWNVVERGSDLALGRYTLRSATDVFAISEHTRRYVRTLVGDRAVEILRLGVDTRRFTPALSVAHKARIRARLGLPSDAFILFTARRLVFRNGLDTLLAACAKLREQKDVVVVIGGRGPERPILERVIREENLGNVRLVGFVPDEDLPDFYRAADAFVLPSRPGEGFGRPGPARGVLLRHSGDRDARRRAGGCHGARADGPAGPPGRARCVSRSNNNAPK